MTEPKQIASVLIPLLLIFLLLSCGPTTSVPVAATAIPSPQTRPTLPPASLPPRPSVTPPPTRAIAAPTPTRLPTRTPRPTIAPTVAPTATPPPLAIGPFSLVPAKSGRPAGAIRKLRAASDGTLWLATEQGVGSYLDGTWTLHLDGDADLAGFDAAGRVYVGLDGDTTMAVWDGSAWTYYGAAEGWSPPLRSSLAFGETPVVDERDWIWLATCEDVRSFDGTRWTVHTMEEIGFVSDEPDYACIWDVAVDSTGDVWAGECEWWGPGPWGDGARWFDGQSWQGADSSVVGSDAGCMSDIEVDSAGRIWVGKGGVLWHYTPGEGWAQREPPAAQPEWGGRWGAMYDLTLGPEGDFWLALEPCGGASCLGEWVRYHLVGNEWFMIGGPYWHSELSLAPDGSAWFCMQDAVYHVVDNIPTLVAELSTDWRNPCTIEVDAAGWVWLAARGEDALYVNGAEK